MDLKVLGAVAVVIIAAAAWSPWLSRQTAESLATSAFEAEWKGVMDGCGLNCKEEGCGVVSSQKALFGYSVTIAYKCGLTLRETPPQQATVFVSFLGTVHGIRGL